MIDITYSLKESDIHGTGIFTDEYIPKGKIIWKWTGMELSHEDFLKLDSSEQERLRHCAYRSKNTGNWFLCGDDIEYINHADDANTTEHIDPHSGAGTLIAKRDIHPGEELTQDYREFESEEDLKARGINI